jgi:hypothetical protein
MLRTPAPRSVSPAPTCLWSWPGWLGAKWHEEQPWIPLLLLAKSLRDAGGEHLPVRPAGLLVVRTASPALLVATVPSVLPEARRKARKS